MSRTPKRPAVLRHRPFLARQAIRAGLLTREQLRGPTWRRLLRGVYADAAIPVDHGLKIRGAGLVIPPDAALTGVSAAWLWGARLASPYDPVDVVRPPDRRLGLTCGLRVRSSPLPASDVETSSGFRLTTPLRTAWELALRLHLVEAVVYCDSLAARGRIDQAGLTGYLRERAGEHGCRIAGRVFSLVDGRSESPQESRLRVWLLLAGVRPTLQHEIWVTGEFVARVDFAWPELKVAVEYDGLWHADAGQLVRDRERLNRLQAAGWYVHHVTVHDMSDIQRTVSTIRELLSRRTRQ